MRAKLIILSVMVGLLTALPVEAIKVYKTKSEGLADVTIYETDSEGRQTVLSMLRAAKGWRAAMPSGTS